MPKYDIWTTGCQLYKAESARLSACLDSSGYRAAAAVNEADLIILNSCVVRQSAEDRVVNKLLDLKALKKLYPEKLLAVTGCLVKPEANGLKDRFGHVDHFFRPGDMPSWLPGREDGAIIFPDKPPVSVFVPIMQGCNNFCSYCIVPYRRGQEKSRPVAEVVCEVGAMVDRGVREVTLLGQNVDSYGRDTPGGPELADLLTELNGLPGLARLRFLTNHPKDMSPRLVRAVASLDKVCEEIGLPVQSGSDEILRLMRRGYTAARYRALVQDIRNQVPQVSLSTDVIVGFPSESGGQFQETLDLLSEIKFDTVHVAVYSPREGTLAARELNDDVAPADKKARLAVIEKRQEEIASEINARFLGRTVEVLVERKTRGKWSGRTRGGKIVFSTDKAERTGKLTRVRITRTGAWSMQGEPES
ncbi:MAG: MiaB/RimO family radical SAM methylthiotransferase [Chloroflexi bacterium]|nr:MiaB/RimO family radical SAM methylthiotransferase [Chloroflexota bacterium]